MGRPIFPMAALGALLVVLHGTSAHALNAKSWVANAGNDGNDCSLAHPCATFQRAHDQTSPGGEIGVLTPGDYGDYGVGTLGDPLQIAKSVSITNDGTGEASILADQRFEGSAGIFINAGAGVVVNLRGLVVDGQGTGLAGIFFVQASALHIQNCVIRNFEAAGAWGIFFSHFGKSQLFVSDTIVFNNGNGRDSGGILVAIGDAGSTNRAVLDRVHLENNVHGLVIASATGLGQHVIVRDSVISGNAADGIAALAITGQGPAFAVVERSSIVNNRQSGILADGPGATLLLSDSTVARNGVGISTVNSGQLISYGNNRINNNIGPDGAPTSFLALN